MPELFDIPTHPLTWSEIEAELERELGMRAMVYPGWVAARKLNQHTADQRVRRLQAALAVVRAAQAAGVALP